ncbi:MAG: hypothetical protein VW258_04625 [Thalassolituus sp.]
MLSSTPCTKINDSKKSKDRSVLVKGVLLLAIISLAACGGGGGSKKPPADTGTDITITEGGDQSLEDLLGLADEDDTDTDGDGVADKDDAAPNDDQVAGIIIVRRDIGSVEGAGGTETVRFSTFGLLRDRKTDEDSDGTPEAIYSYNSNRQLISLQLDSNDDGTIDQSYNYAYDSSIRTSEIAAGETDNYTKTHIFANGIQQRTDTDQGSDGSIDLQDIYTYHPEDASKISQVRLNVTTDDSDIAEKVIDYIYDAELMLTDIQFSTESPVATVKTIEYTYHSNGAVETSTLDEDADGNPEYTFSYNEDGVLLTADLDSDSDGTIETTETYSYSENYLLQIDSNGAENNLVVFNYRSDRQIDNVTEDIEDDGSIDITTTYNYDDSGRQTSINKVVAADSSNNESVVILREGYLTFTTYYVTF